MSERQKFKINQKVWRFDGNIWNAVQDEVYDYHAEGNLYELVYSLDQSMFEESELFVSKNKCLTHYGHNNAK